MTDNVSSTLPDSGFTVRVYVGDEPVELTLDDFGADFAEARAQGSIREPTVEDIGRALDSFMSRRAAPVNPNPGPIEPTPGPIRPVPAPIAPRPSPIIPASAPGLMPLREAMNARLIHFAP